MSSNSPALSLSLDPGEYQCFVTLPTMTGGTEPMPGRLHLRADEPPTAEIYGDVTFVIDEPGNSASFPQSTSQPVIQVDLARGDVILLLQCDLQVQRPGRADIQAAAAVVRGTTPTTGHYLCAGATVQITGSDAVLGPPPLGPIEEPRGAKDPTQPFEWSLIEQFPRKIEASDTHATVSASRVIAWSPPTRWYYRVAFSPVINITLTEPAPLDVIVEQWIEPLRRIMSLATGRSERVTYLEVRGTDEPARPSTTDVKPVPVGRQVYGSGIGQNPYSSDGNTVLRTKLAFIAWGQNNPTLLALCRAWQHAEQSRHPLIETLGTLLFIPKLHPRPRYLLFVQALEGLHGHDHRQLRRQRQKTHTANHASATADIESSAEISTATKRFVKRHLMCKPIESLEPALTAAVTELPFDLTARFASLALVTDVLSTDGAAVTGWAGALRVVRNGLSHGTRDWPRDELEAAADLLEVVARAHMMRLIGCADDAIARWLGQQHSH